MAGDLLPAPTLPALPSSTLSAWLRPVRHALGVLLLVSLVPAALAQPAPPAPASAPTTSETGIAAVYASDLEGRPTASGEPYASGRLTAAHRTLPFGSRVRVTDAVSARSVVVVINDRWGGPPGQIVNLSRAAADQLGMGASGQRRVRLEVETLGDGRRQAAIGEIVAPRSLPARVELEATDARAKQRTCSNEAAILGLKDEFYATHVRACLARKPRT